MSPSSTSSVSKVCVERVQVVEQPGQLPRDLAAFLPDLAGSLAAPTSLDAVAALADSSLQAVAERLQVEHLNCEEAELAIIHGFMQQLAKQVLINVGDFAACKQLLRALAARRYDVQGHVHTWYWAGAVAQQQQDWPSALAFFKQAALTTLERPHLSMQAKALTASCECILSSIVVATAPALSHAGFAEEIAQLPRGCSKWARHAALCRELLPTLQAPRSPTSALPHEAVWDWPTALVAVQALLKQALENSKAASDEGVELRALMSVLFLLRADGTLLVRGASDGVPFAGYQWQPAARIPWLAGAPLVADVFARWQCLMCFRRNVLSLWRMVCVHVVLDPDSEWGQAADGAAAMALLA